MKLTRVVTASLIITGTSVAATLKAQNNKPNIIYILADDWGYGDVSCLNSESKIKTPHTDKIAREGMIFSDAHSNSAVCTPTRYGILTGRYSWRSDLKNGVLWGHDKLLIEKNRVTVASFLKENGYNTAYIGKWHLGLDWQTTDNQKPNRFNQNNQKENDNIDYTKDITRGPKEVGFDYSYGLVGSLDMPPYVYVENGKVTAQPDRETGQKVKYCWWRKGPTGSDFKHEEVLENFTQRGVKYIQEYAKKDKPFFLYLPLAAPHTPILPSEKFKGKSNLSLYGDFVLQVDDTIGRITKAINDAEISENTIIVITSDNGCSPLAGIPEMQAKGHYPSYIYRGHKADIFEGGHRIPFIVRWPAKVKANSVSNDTICLTDLLATTADILNKKLPDSSGVDSVSILPDLEGVATKPVREAVVHHSIQGKFSIRQGDWKLNFCPGSGGWSHPRRRKDIEKLPKLQLYNIKKDPSEKANLVAKYPEKVKALTILMKKYIDEGRSTPGKMQKNNKHGKIWSGIKNIIDATNAMKQ